MLKRHISARFCRLTALAVYWVFTLSTAVANAQLFNAPDADVFVSPEGNDGWSGRLAKPNRDRSDGPVASLRRAQEIARAERRSMDGPKPITVMIREGRYSLSDPLIFTPVDGGSPGAPVTWTAYPGDHPVVSGGRAIKGWREHKDGMWVADVPDALADPAILRQVFVNGKRAVRCRMPNEGTFRSAGPLKPRPRRGSPEWRDKDVRIGFYTNEGDIEPWDDLAAGTAVVFHSWTASVHWLDEVDADTHTVRFTAGSGWPMGYWEKNQRYYIEHVRAALDQPGEWYLDASDARLYYIPREGERIDDLEVIVPRLTHLLELRGDADTGVYVEHLTFRGLSFQHAAFVLPRNTVHDGQAAASLGAAVTTVGARECTFEDIEVAHVGEYGLWFGAGTRECVLEKSHLHDLGAGGVRIGTTRTEKDPVACRANTVRNCFIHDGGHIAKAGVGVWIGRTSYHTVEHNDICDFYYTGVSVGWSWGYAASSANHNTVAYNHIHHIGNGVLSDMGGIYCLGISPGTVLRGNVMHDIFAYSYGGWGLYTDEGSSYILMEKNVVYNTKSGGFHQHYGEDNILRHNILAFSREGQVIRSRQEDHLSFTFEKNIVLFDNGRPLGGNWSDGNYRLDGNIYWDVTGKPFDFSGYTFEEWQEHQGQDLHSIVEDPAFRDPRNGDFRLASDSPVHMMMIEPLEDVGKAGLYGPKRWTRLPDAVDHRGVSPQMKPPRERPRRTFVKRVAENVENVEAGAKVPDAQTNEAGTATIRASAEISRPPGGKSLKFLDADNLEHEWQPHMYYRMNWRTGTVVGTFDVYLKSDARLWHEWRQYNGSYLVGPAIRFQEDGTVTSGDKVLMSYPTDTWIHVEIVCPLDKAVVDKGFDLTVTVSGEQPRHFTGLPMGSESWRSLTWVGFISEAKRKSVFYVDNLSFERKK